MPPRSPISSELREAPRLGEADRRSPERDRAHRESVGARRQVHRGGEARVGEAEEAVCLDRAVGEGARLQSDAPRGAGRALQAVRAREGLGQARRRLETQARLIDDRVKKVAALQKLGLLFTDKVERAAQATAAWRALLDVEPENKRAQDALKKLYVHAEELRRAREVLSPRRTSSTSTSACSSAQVETEDDATKIVLTSRSRSSIAIGCRRPIARCARTRRCCRSTRTTSPAAEALIPLYEGAKDARKLVACARDPARAHARVGRARRAHAAARRALGAAAQGQGGGVRLVAQALRRGSARDRCARGARAARQGDGRLDRARRRLRSGVRQGRPTIACRSCWSWRACRKRSRPSRTRRSPPTSRSSSSTSNNAQAHRRARALVPAHRALRRAARHLREEARARERQGSAERDPLQGRVDLRGRDQGRREGDRGLSGHPRGQPATSCRRSARSIASTWRRAVEGAVAGDHARAQARAAGRQRQHRRAQVPARAAARAAPRRRQGRDRHVSRHPRPRADARQARARRSSGASATTSISSRRRPSSSRSTSSTEEWARAHRGARDPARVARRRSRAACRSCCASASCSRRRLATPSQGVRRLRARVPRGSVDGDGAQRARAGWRRSTIRTPSWSRCTSRRSRSSSPRASKRRCSASSRSRSPRRTTRSSRSRRRRSSTSGGRSRSSPMISTRSRRSSGSSRATRSWPELLEVYRKKVELSPNEASAREQIYFRMAYAPGGDARQRRRGDRDVQGDPRPDSANIKALKALDRLYLGGKQWRDRWRQLNRQLPAHRREVGDRSRCSCASRQLRETRARRSGGRGRHLSPGARSRRDERRGAARARATDRRSPSTSCTIATILEPIYKARDEWQKLDRHVRDHGAPLDRSGAQDRAAPSDRRAVRDRRRRRRRRSRTYRSRAARGSGAQGDADASRAAGAHARSLEGSGLALRLGRRAGGELVGRRRIADAASDAHRADRRDAARRQRRRGGRVRSRAQGGTASARRGQRDRDHLPPHRRVHQARRRRAGARSRSSAPPTRRRSCCSRRRRSTKRCWRTPIAPSTSIGRCCRSTRTIATRSTRSSACTSASSAGSRSRTSTRRRPSSLRRPTRRSRCSSCSARSTTASSRISTRAIETYQTILDLDAGRRAPRSRRSIGSISQAGRWYDLLADPRARGRAVVVDGRDGVAQASHRPAVGEASSRISARAIEAYRDVLRHRRHARPTLRRARRPGARRVRSRCWRRRCSSRSTRRAASARSSSTCSR